MTDYGRRASPAAEPMYSGAEKRTYRFEGFVVDPMRRVLLRDGETVPITPKAFSILLVLIERSGEVVAKEELIQRVWASAYVSDANLMRNVSSLRKALGEKAGDGRFVVTVPGQGYTFAVPVEIREESGIFPRPDFAELRREEPLPEGGARQPEESAPVPRMRPVLRIAISLAAGAILIAAISLSLTRLAGGASEPREDLGSVAPPRRPSVAVLGFKDLSPSRETAWLAPALAEMLSTELAADPRLRVVSRTDVARARSLVEIGDAGTVGGETLTRIQTIVGAERLVIGTYLALPDKSGRRIRLDIRVVEAPSGEVLVSLAEVGRESELFDVVSRSGARLRQALGYDEPSPAQVQAARALRPADTEAMQLYAQGLDRLHAYDAPRALELLQQAADAEPASAVIRSALAQALEMIGYDARAVAQAEKAVELSASLPREERLGMQARLQAVRQEWDGASATYRTLWTFYPDDLEYGLQLANSLLRAGRFADSRETLAALHRLPAPRGDDARIDVLEARLGARTSDKAAQLRAARAAIGKGRRSGEVLLVAQALVYEGDALMAAGHTNRAVLDFREAKRLAEREGQPFILGMAL
ncbi:MAG TPA: winged helix-turn-helix domain-containing protein, partial [Thermoanaerobaculia bacterium]|nr:winged helix-turn-helix domain-containing protein [Thermoanaerobaculia bacterium]